MMKPGIGAYDRFKQLFDASSAEAGKKQYLIPYFIAAHPGTSDEDMMNLALWLKKNGFRADQVQTFYPEPDGHRDGDVPHRPQPAEGHQPRPGRAEKVDIVRGERRRRLHKAFLRWHDANNWPLLREALMDMGRADLIGNGKQHLIPTFQPAGTGSAVDTRRQPASRTAPARPAVQAPQAGRLLTQHTGLPPRSHGAAAQRKPGGAAPRRKR